LESLISESYMGYDVFFFFHRIKLIGVLVESKSRSRQHVYSRNPGRNPRAILRKYLQYREHIYCNIEQLPLCRQWGIKMCRMSITDFVVSLPFFYGTLLNIQHHVWLCVLHRDE
jgi:hypothetical protein